MISFSPLSFLFNFVSMNEIRENYLFIPKDFIDGEKFEGLRERVTS